MRLELTEMRKLNEISVGLHSSYTFLRRVKNTCDIAENQGFVVNVIFKTQSLDCNGCYCILIKDEKSDVRVPVTTENEGSRISSHLIGVNTFRTHPLFYNKNITDGGWNYLNSPVNCEVILLEPLS